jgi:hypothetical protein
MRWYKSYALLVVFFILLWLSSYTRLGSFVVALDSNQSTILASNHGTLKIGRHERKTSGLGDSAGEVGQEYDQGQVTDQVLWTKSVYLPGWPPWQRAAYVVSSTHLYQNGVVLSVTESTTVTGIAWWFIIVILGLPLLLPVILSKKRLHRRRLRQGLCPECGYDLRATPTRCPECGWSAATA